MKCGEGTPNVDSMPDDESYMVGMLEYEMFYPHPRSSNQLVLVPPLPLCMKWWFEPLQLRFLARDYPIADQLTVYNPLC